MADRIVLEPLAELVAESDKRRRKILTNLDRIAQGALDASRSYTNKHGEESVIPQPDWNVAVKAMESAKVILGLGLQDSPPAGTETAVERMTRELSERASRS